mmetsp:Transcript_35136/g.58881  ORF Transcript_35136/g.58881 Transcript_35136/m.58881 type:complete len:81 (-) Transcript_35136:374-616(-)
MMHCTAPATHARPQFWHKFSSPLGCEATQAALYAPSGTVPPKTCAQAEPTRLRLESGPPPLSNKQQSEPGRSFVPRFGEP